MPHVQYARKLLISHICLFKYYLNLELCIRWSRRDQCFLLGRNFGISYGILLYVSMRRLYEIDYHLLSFSEKSSLTDKMVAKVYMEVYVRRIVLNTDRKISPSRIKFNVPYTQISVFRWKIQLEK